MALLATVTLGTSACDRVRSALNPPPTVDRSWSNDSTLLAAEPVVVFRVVRDSTGRRIVPFASVGSQGLQALSLSDRGWRAFDLQYLHAGNSFVPIRGSNTGTPVPSTRGMWDPTALDSLPGCALLLPAAVAAVPDDVELLLSRELPQTGSQAALSQGELQEILHKTNTLTAPTLGLSLSRMGEYRRQVHVVTTGASPRPTVVVSYDEVNAVMDSARVMEMRPSNLIIVLDQGGFGYRPTLTLADVGTSRSGFPRKFLGALDTDGDGKRELLFGLRTPEAPLVAVGYRLAGDSWTESFTYNRQRCQRGVVR